MSAIIIENEIVHYEVLGRGRPLIFVHGWVGSWRYWVPTMQSVSSAYRAYALDLWGFGDTSKSNSRYTLQEQVNLLERFLEEMGIGKIALIGHGLGAIVALLYVRQFPHLVDRVMAIGYPMRENALNKRLTTSPPEELEKWLLAGTPLSDMARLEARKTDAQAIVHSILNLQELDLKGLSREVNIPCLFVHGLNDPAIMVPNGNKIEAFAENFHLVIFENSGHYPMLSQPNKFNRLLNDFLALDSGESPRNLQLKDEWKRRVR